MSVIAEAQINTERARRYLAQLFEHLQAKANAHANLLAQLEWSETHGMADFGWGRCTMQADPNALALRAEAADQEGLEQVQEFVTRHLEKLGADEQLRIEWQQPGVPAAYGAESAKRRERMRQFHRRARP